MVRSLWSTLPKAVSTLRSRSSKPPRRVSIRSIRASRRSLTGSVSTRRPIDDDHPAGRQGTLDRRRPAFDEAPAPVAAGPMDDAGAAAAPGPGGHVVLSAAPAAVAVGVVEEHDVAGRVRDRRGRGQPQGPRRRRRRGAAGRPEGRPQLVDEGRRRRCRDGGGRVDGEADDAQAVALDDFPRPKDAVRGRRAQRHPNRRLRPGRRAGGGEDGGRERDAAAIRAPHRSATGPCPRSAGLRTR